MNSEKVKEIKKALECCAKNNPDCDNCPYSVGGGSLCRQPEQDALTLINELESENERLKQSNKNILFVNEKVIERNQELEESLLDMVVQFCQIGKEGYLHHTFMSAEENAFDVLDIEYGENVDDVYKRFNEKWGRNN
jgi:hypothetical protein